MSSPPSKWSIYSDEIKEQLAEGTSIRSTAKIILEKHGILNKHDWSTFRTYISRHKDEFTSDTADAFEETLEDNNFTYPEGWEYGWLKTKKASVFIKNQKGVVSFEQMRQEFIDEMKNYAPSFKRIKRTEITEPHLLVIDIADLHIGKYASEQQTGDGYNSDIALQRATQGVAGILDKAAGFPLDKILFVIGNDVLHVDNASSTTTGGTHQNSDGMWFENYQRARKLYVGIIETLLSVADVHIVHNPSNHDFVTGFMLADSVASWFRNSPNVSFDVSPSFRKYYQYGTNLIGTSHGDGAKMDTLPLIMANEAKMMWATTQWRYIYLHHIHHKKQFKFASGNDYHGVNVEYMRSPSGTDEWHSKYGYQHAPKAIEGFIHHKEYGQVARITHLFK